MDVDALATALAQHLVHGGLISLGETGRESPALSPHSLPTTSLGTFLA
jgi:hypothetical protein